MVAFLAQEKCEENDQCAAGNHDPNPARRVKLIPGLYRLRIGFIHTPGFIRSLSKTPRHEDLYIRIGIPADWGRATGALLLFFGFAEVGTQDLHSHLVARGAVVKTVRNKLCSLNGDFMD